jgi:hypothetical protein
VRALAPEDVTSSRRLGRSAPRPRRHQLVDRDVEILRWIARHGVVTTDLVARRYFWRQDLGRPGTRAAYRRIRILEGLGLVLRDRPFARDADILRVSRQGASVADVGLQPAPLVLAELRHTILVVWVTEYLLARIAGAELVTERELRAQRYRERLAEDVPRDRGRIPDALLRVPATAPLSEPQTIALELDRVRKDTRTMVEIIRRYNRNLDVDLVWWFVSAGRVERVRELVRSQGAHHRIQVWEVPTWRT